MKVNKYIFREYDIRGKVNDDFPPEVVLNLGKAFGTFIKRSGGQEIALSGDVRLSTPSLIDRGCRIVSQLTNVDEVVAKRTLVRSNMSVKTAIVMIYHSVGFDKAKKRIDDNNGMLRKIIS